LDSKSYWIDKVSGVIRLTFKDVGILGIHYGVGSRFS